MTNLLPVIAVLIVLLATFPAVTQNNGTHGYRPSYTIEEPSGCCRAYSCRITASGSSCYPKITQWPECPSGYMILKTLSDQYVCASGVMEPLK